MPSLGQGSESKRTKKKQERKNNAPTGLLMYPSHVLVHKWGTAVVSPTPSQQQCSDFYASVNKLICPVAAPLSTMVKNLWNRVPGHFF